MLSPDFVPEVVDVIPHGDYTVDVIFRDGKQTKFDAKDIVGRGVFAPLEDKELFVNSCLVMNRTLSWDIYGNRNSEESLDIDPLVLYSLDS